MLLSIQKRVVWLTLATTALLSKSSSAAEIVLGSFTNRDHGIQGEVVALSDRVLEVRGFGYDGTAPDAFFWADTNPVPTGDGFILSDGDPTNNCGQEPLAFADGMQTYRVEFPDGTSLKDIKGGTISVWCRQFGANFGEIVVDETLLAGVKAAEDGPALTCHDNMSTNAFVDEIVLGSFIDRDHDIAGEVVALSERVLEVRGFGYDGTAPDAFFWADTSAIPSGNGFILSDADPTNGCGQEPLGFADGMQTYRVEFPDGTSLKDIKGGTISVWCRQFGANFGEIVVDESLLMGLKPADLGPALTCHDNVPATEFAEEVVLGTFPDRDHDVVGEVVALSDTVLEVRGFGYDGTAPDAFFWADTSDVPSGNGFILSDGSPSSNCGQEPLGFADGTQTYRVEFPEGTSLKDIKGGTISVWCRQFGANFGEIVVDEALLESIKPAEVGPELECSTGGNYDEINIMETPEGYNCEPLHEDFQVRWKVDGEEIAFELIGSIGDIDYLGFGISGDDTRTEMVGADVVIGDLFNGEFRATDYYMSARAQCSNGAGVCPDTGDFDQSVTEVSGDRDDDAGVTIIRYKRKLMATDSALVSGATVDRNISVVPGEQTYIAWAMGPVSQDTGFPNFHSIAFGREDVTLEFGRPVQDNCEPLVEMEEEEVVEEIDAFERPVIRGQTELYTAIGPSGGDRGYLGITGRVGWGIAWYVNDLLLPVIEMERGKTYTFFVNGGDVPTDSANHHPMYITDSISGGYAQISEEERMAETIFAGLTVNDDQTFEATAEGPICRYEAGDETSQAMINGTYDEFYATLDTSCNQDASIRDAAAVLQFTPDENTPDLLYYQCVTHRNLGWEIRIVDSGSTLEEEEDDMGAVSKSLLDGFFRRATEATPTLRGTAAAAP